MRSSTPSIIGVTIALTLLATTISPNAARVYTQSPVTTPAFIFAPLEISKGVTRYADSSLTVTSCTNYSPSTRRCSGGNEIAYGGPLAIENAANASAATDQILVRSGGPTYIGTGNSPFKCVVPRHGTSTSSRFLIRGYQDEIPTLKCIFGGQYVHFYQLKIEDGQADGIGVMGFSFSRFENLEVSNHGAQGISFVDNSELINLNVHHNGFNSPNHCQLPGGGAQCHGVYADDSLLIHGGKYHHNEGMGIHCYTHCRNTTIRNLHAYANKTVGVGVFNSKPNPGVAVYNVLAYKNGTYGLDASAEGIYYNITAVNNGVAPVRHGMLGTIKNSILLGEYSTATFHFGTGKFLGNSTASNNIITGSAASLFVDRANGNF